VEKLFTQVEAWIADDPDPGARAELAELLARAVDGSAAATDQLRDRFAGRLRFGTAGLRGVMAAGPNRMNRAMVRAATAAVAGWVVGGWASMSPHPPPRTPCMPSIAVDESSTAIDDALRVVVGCDARHQSAEFADEALRVFAGAGIPVHVLPLPCPTPLLAFAVRHLSAAAGVMITASHNPAADNGYKLYLSDGAQVIPPVDAEIEDRMSRLGPLSLVSLADADSPLITRHGDEIADSYLDAVVTSAGEVCPLRVVYTPMHGVAGPLMLRAISRAGFGDPHVVAEQAEPDPDFPTVAFPNPEEPGALDLALAEARATGADLVLASDPDGDRLAVAVPVPDGGWRRLTGNQLGSLLGSYLLRESAGGAERPRGVEQLCVSTIVSSTMLRKIAAAAGARFAETLTGFKWITRAGDSLPGSRFVFGYEEALGYQVGTAVRDKDGIGAALAVLRMASAAAAKGRTLLDEYDDLERAHGVHATAQVSARISEPGEVMRRLRESPPSSLAGLPVKTVTDYLAAPGLPASDVLRYEMDNTRVAIRPSGTEPKIKTYLEVISPAEPTLDLARERAAGRTDVLHSAIRQILEEPAGS
jgi:phosphomannomutase